MTRSRMNGMRVALGLALVGMLPAAGAAQDKVPQVKVGGVVYAQYLYQLTDEADGANNFDIIRAYVNVLGSLGGGFATRVTADIYRVADGSLPSGSSTPIVACTPDGSPVTFKLGQMQTPWIEWEEALWDYRMQGTVAVDRNGYMSVVRFRRRDGRIVGQGAGQCTGRRVQRRELQPDAGRQGQGPHGPGIGPADGDRRREPDRWTPGNGLRADGQAHRRRHPAARAGHAVIPLEAADARRRVRDHPRPARQPACPGAPRPGDDQRAGDHGVRRAAHPPAHR